MTSPRPPDAARLREILAAFRGLPVVVFGDLVLDEFQVGRIDRISREAPVLILEHLRVDRAPGGGANAVANVAALGGAPRPVGPVGDDDAGAALRSLLSSAGVDVSGLLTVDRHATPTKTRILAGSSTSVQQQVVRIDRNLRGSIPDESRRALVRAVAERVASGAALLVSDYGHGALDADAVGAMPPAGGSVFTVDSRRRLAAFRGMTAATPNLEEAAAALGRPVADEDAEVAEAAIELRTLLGARHMIITRGSHGMTLAADGEEPAHLPVFGTDEVADVTGAGDTVIAALTLALAAGAKLLEAAQLANVAAGLAVMKRGTATVAATELHEALGELHRGR